MIQLIHKYHTRLEPEEIAQDSIEAGRPRNPSVMMITEEVRTERTQTEPTRQSSQLLGEDDGE